MEFKQSVKEALAYYVYALVDPRDHKIFYIGKGKDNRVFQHAAATIDEIEQGLKLETIKDIISEGKQVEYYILRHNLDEKEAYLVESAIIVNYVLGVYKGVVRCVIKVKSYEFVDKSDDGTVFKKPRCCFEGEQCLDSIYLNKDVTDYPFGSGGSVRYIF